MQSNLPPMASLILPAFLTLRKGKKVSPKGIHLKRQYTNINIDQSDLADFRKYFQFTTENPLSFLYVLAQRAQTHAMLASEFSIAIPGMVHMGNNLILHETYDAKDAFELKVEGVVAYKKEGSLIPLFTVEFLQRETLIATCKSTYIVKRKSKSKSKKDKQYAEVKKPDFEEQWHLKREAAKAYAKISGDKNPIHLYTPFARILGFKNVIMHGWYSICRLERLFEENHQAKTNEIDVDFLQPIVLPHGPMVGWSSPKEQIIEFSVYEKIHTKNLIAGRFKLAKDA